MNNIIHPKDIFQQWHHAQSTSTISPAKCTAISTPATATMAKAAATTATAALNSANTRQSQQLKRKHTQTFIKLADESVTPTEIDESEYDSLNEQETDFCRDSCDDLSNDGYVTDSIVEVLEYELADTSASEDLYTDDGSSDDELIEMAAVVSAIFDSTSSSDSDRFEIFAADADTEESDAPTDPELGCADYWTCIKCKNQKNNPMYRFCEKCYQIRKTHFPPRPKQRKKRNAKSKATAPSNHRSAGSRSSSALSTHDDKLLDISGNASTLDYADGGSDDIIGNSLTNTMASHNHQSKHATTHRRHSKTHRAHNSAGDSSCSSQEMSPDEQQPATYHPSKYMNGCPGSQSTFGSDNERMVDSPPTKKSNLNILEARYSNSINCVSSQDSGFNSQEFPTTITTSMAVMQHAPCIDADEVRLRSVGNAVQVAATSSNASQASTLSTYSQDTLKMTEDESPALLSPSPSGLTGKQRKKRKRKATFSEVVSSDDDDNDSDHYDGPMEKQLKTLDQLGNSSYGMCGICLSQPKDAAFLHNRFIHIYACYRCSVKVWNKRKKCPICNSQVKTVLKFSVY